LNVSYWIYQLKFRHPFTISKGTKTHQPTFVVELEWNGIKGYGEAPAIAYYNITVEKMAADLEQKKFLVERFAFTEPERYWHYLHHLFPGNSFLVCALDMAAWDLFGKISKLPLYRIWNTNIDSIPLTDYTIGIDSIEKMALKMKEKPWPIYKIKVGTSDDLNMVKSLREHTHALIRVDANAAWTVETALEIIPKLRELDVELVEQPLAKDDWEGMKKLYKESTLPLVADESCVEERDIDKCPGHFHGVNIKLTKCSGITPAIRMIKRAREKSLKIMLGCMNESTIGSAAIVQLSPLVNYLDADGPLLLDEDIATGLRYDYGKISIQDRPGLGIDFTGKI
jgi:L-Ala-D/L-Glu epimerase